MKGRSKMCVKCSLTLVFVMQLTWTFIPDANATFRAACRVVYQTALEEGFSASRTFTVRRFSGSASPAFGRVASDLQKELDALKQSHNPTGEVHRKQRENPVTVYPEWDLASSKHSVSEVFDVVTDVKSVPGIGLIGTLKKK